MSRTRGRHRNSKVHYAHGKLTERETLMSRTKLDYTGTVNSVGGLTWIKPIYENTETANYGHNVPAMVCTGPDGRRWFITFESEFSAPNDGTSRERYISRMRHMAATILAEADRMESNPKR